MTHPVSPVRVCVEKLHSASWNGIILKLLICPFLNILWDDIQISRTSLPRCRVDMPARGCRWSVRGGRGVLQGGGGGWTEGLHPPLVEGFSWHRCCTAGWIDRIDWEGNFTQSASLLHSASTVVFGLLRCEKNSPLVEPAPPLSLPHACCEIIIQTYSCSAKIPKRLRPLSSIAHIYKIRPVQ